MSVFILFFLIGALIRERYALIRKILAFIRKSFALSRESFACIRGKNIILPTKMSLMAFVILLLNSKYKIKISIVEHFYFKIHWNFNVKIQTHIFFYLSFETHSPILRFKPVKSWPK